MNQLELIKFLKDRSIIEDNGCWVWKLSKVTGGYGQLYLEGKRWQVHRLSWTIYNGPNHIHRLQVCHRCDNPPCWNPEHLFLGTRRQNMLDSYNKGRGRWNNFEVKKEEKLIKFLLREIQLAER